jgi:hypothetical protein
MKYREQKNTEAAKLFPYLEPQICDSNEAYFTAPFNAYVSFCL